MTKVIALKRDLVKNSSDHSVKADAQRLSTFFVMAFGSVPNWGASCGRSTGLLISDGTDSVLRILATGRNNWKSLRA